MCKIYIQFQDISIDTYSLICIYVSFKVTNVLLIGQKL